MRQSLFIHIPDGEWLSFKLFSKALFTFETTSVFVLSAINHLCTKYLDLITEKIQIQYLVFKLEY